ncbi:prepilin-type N-terminal cleavage/methylation domain-containing protein [Fictibacillus sp. 7GRE50]|uniref:prepilin-type N-terminal cleavage/methylation domain-containing protein n=1 Tax=Fictibacillus sp. 7GRE50 TaxID=2745878 RepID=UPI0018CCC9A0|nr:prepilin-type N-terminal cleavage/methylation domain-containing protein [Fictibacillus sp. 7GRE50]MBH0164035.1 prepilin-type N-terminal cleavage/methylation domain-containing protein [Fictibacillus sp. 7GRE50]
MFSEKGFSLVEVLVSLTILSVSVIAFSNLFIQADEISSGNNQKLVATNLARMTLDRIQQKPIDYGIKVPIKDVYSNEKCYDLTADACNNLYTTIINNVKYSINVTTSPGDAKEVSANLFPVIVTVSYQLKEKSKDTSVEGYVSYDK